MTSEMNMSFESTLTPAPLCFLPVLLCRVCCRGGSSVGEIVVGVDMGWWRLVACIVAQLS